MKKERVQEILDSKGVIDVDYEGESVWIQSLNDDETAEIKFIDGKIDTKVVDVSDLCEANKEY